MDQFDDDFAPLQSSDGPSAIVDEDDAPLFLGDEICDDEPKENVIMDNGIHQNHSRFSPNDDQGSTGSSDHSSHKQELREDPEVIKIWKEEQAIMLEAKDRVEEKAKLALKQQAKRELEDWYRQHSEQMGKLQAAHRAASCTTERELASTTSQQPMAPGTEWERIAKLCDFNPKSAKNTKDVSRMRSVILQLKQGGTPPTTINSC